MGDSIKIFGAREHNLKNIDVKIPKNKLVVITGVSGSGKSSLAFDIIYAEGQRRYVESLSSYARGFLDLSEKPDVDKIEGLSPTIAIEPKTSGINPRSTVGTITEIYDFLRILFARIGHPHCPFCGKELKKQSLEEIVEQIFDQFSSSEIFIFAPCIYHQKGTHLQTLEEIKKLPFEKIRIDGILYNLKENLPLLEKNKFHNIEILIGELVLKDKIEIKGKLIELVKLALKYGKGKVIIFNKEEKKEHLFSEYYGCIKCGFSIPEISPRFFSFNSPVGACPSCSGLGTKLVIDPELVIPNPRLTLAEGAIQPWARATSRFSWYVKLLEAVGKKKGFSVNVPVNKLSKNILKIILWGTGEERYELDLKGKKTEVIFEGVIPDLERKYKESQSEYIKKEIERYMRTYTCPDCKGRRLKKEVLAVTILGKSIADFTEMQVSDLIKFLNLKEIEKDLSKKEYQIALPLLKEIKKRLSFLIDVGVPYLTLSRSATTLSGGEIQRLRLATQIGSGLSGVIYVLDEPTIGLHPKDTQNLIKTLKDLRDLLNTVIVVEHDRSVIESADFILDIGPGAGINGGKIVVAGSLSKVKNSKKSLTGLYLSKKRVIEFKKKRRKGNGKYLKIIGASHNNLKNIDVKIPLGVFVCVTGVSGSGKSSLIYDILAKKLSVEFHHAKIKPGAHKRILGLEHLDKVIDIDQSPIGRSPRSNPATYTGLFTYIREIFANLKESKIKGLTEGAFSFNVKGGRCENCKGEGLIKIEMYLLPDVYVICDKCQGKRYKKEILEIYYKGKNIADILEMTVDEAAEFFKEPPPLIEKLKLLQKVGLGYLKLGQSATTLSGGEAQRVKLAAELSRRATGKTIYILDEPTTGLHFEDIKKLLSVLHQLVDKGNTVIVIEHNLDVIKTADWVIDLGPEGGEEGGYLIAQGTPEDLIKIKRSYTGQWLRKVL